MRKQGRGPVLGPRQFKRIERAFGQYVTEVLDSGLTETSQRACISHAESFVRWIEEPEILDQPSRKEATKVRKLNLGDIAMPALASQEIVMVVDDENRPVAEAPRHRMRSENLPHRATYIFVFDRAGRVLVQRRTAIKDMYPGYHDLAAGGVVAAGESYEENAKREAQEELGIRDTALEPKLDFYYEDERNRCFGRVFTCVHEGPFTLQAEEVESVAFHAVEEIAGGEVKLITPDSRLAFDRLLALGETVGATQ